MKPAGAAIAYLHPGEVSHSFHESVRNLMLHDLSNDAHVIAVIAEHCGAARISDGRNAAVRKFLRSNAEWLFFLDADMGFEPDTLDRLLAVADAEERPIVGALCFGQHRGPATADAGATHYQTIPTIYQWIEHGNAVGCVPVSEYPRNALVQCDATGAACFVVHRRVLERVAEHYAPPREWFSESIVGGQVFGEDITFFRRAAGVGFKTLVHTGVKTSHYKHTYLDERSYVPPSKAETFVIIPMKNRFDLTKQLLDQLVEQGEYDAIFVCDNGSKREVKNRLAGLKLPGVEVFDCDGANIHEMWNAGIDEAVRRAWPCNVAILNNDITIGPGFLSGLAYALRTNPLIGAVSPNYDGREGEGLQIVDEICAGRYDGTGGLAGFAFMLKGESGYRFPEELQWWYGDNDMLEHIRLAGARAAIALDVTCEHVDGGGQTGDWDDPEMRKVLAEDRAWFEAKWAPSAAEDYERLCRTPSDINEHLPTLVDLAVEVDAKKIIELGTRGGVSTCALLYAAEKTGGHVWSVDVSPPPGIRHAQWTFVNGHDLSSKVLARLPEQADMVFVDTDHRYELTVDEIAAYEQRVRPGGVMVFHDTSVETFAHHPPGQPPFPVRRAVDEWVERTGYESRRWENNHGLTAVWVDPAG